MYNKSDDEILFLEGVWNLKEKETHFGSHRYLITKFVFSGGKFHQNKIGQTSLKYPSPDDSQPISSILAAIKIKEPALLNNVRVSDYQ